MWHRLCIKAHGYGHHLLAHEERRWQTKIQIIPRTIWFYAFCRPPYAQWHLINLTFWFLTFRLELKLFTAKDGRKTSGRRKESELTSVHKASAEMHWNELNTISLRLECFTQNNTWLSIKYPELLCRFISPIPVLHRLRSLFKNRLICEHPWRCPWRFCSVSWTYMSSLFRMIFTATSWLALALSLARTTLLNTPWPV